VTITAEMKSAKASWRRKYAKIHAGD